jgi:RNA polymerase sigma factor (sigma-70 family)
LSIINGDNFLWEAFRQGDKQAFGELFRTHYPALFQFGSKVTADSALVEDNIQELFVELWQSKAPVPAFSVKAYLLKSLKYKLLRAIRKAQRSPAIYNSDDFQFEFSHEHLLIADQEHKERSQKIKTAVTYLSNRQKEIIYLRFYQNLSYDDICSVMDLKYQVARNLLSQSVKALKRIYFEESLIFLVTLLTLFF